MGGRERYGFTGSRVALAVQPIEEKGPGSLVPGQAKQGIYQTRYYLGAGARDMVKGENRNGPPVFSLPSPVLIGAIYPG